ncbi:MAG: thiopurine S-methyltransferase, partial [Achromobacter sp.]
PFSVVDSEVQAIFAGVSPAKIIDRRDILDKEPKFQGAGVSRLDTVVYRLGV